MKPPKVSSELFTIDHSLFTSIFSLFTITYEHDRHEGPYLLPLRQAVASLIAPHIEQFGRTYFKITAEAYIQPENILLVERLAIE
jgi:hypothetical protein